MKIECESQGQATVIRLSGEFVGAQPELIAAVTDLLTRPGAAVVLDLSGVPYMNSTGLSELVRITAQANIQEGRIVLTQPSAFVEGVLQTSKLDRFFEVTPTVDDALRCLE
jgi:anti-sigma B factor antagonist